jgi:hypothetical protein
MPSASFFTRLKQSWWRYFFRIPSYIAVTTLKTPHAVKKNPIRYHPFLQMAAYTKKKPHSANKCHTASAQWVFLVSFAYNLTNGANKCRERQNWRCNITAQT